MELIVHPAIDTEGKEDDELMELTRKVMSLNGLLAWVRPGLGPEVETEAMSPCRSLAGL